MDYDTTFEMQIDQAINEIDTRKRRNAAVILKTAIELLDKAADSVVEAAKVIRTDPACDRVMSVANGIEDLLCDLKVMQDEYANGVTE